MQITSKIIDICVKIRYWGIKGVVDYLSGYIPKRVHEYRLRRFFLKNVRQYPLTPEHGVTIVADLTTRGAVNKVMRDLAFALKDAGIPFQTLNTSPGFEIPAQDVDGILTPNSEFRLLRYNRIITLMDSPIPPELKLEPSSVFFWEFSTGVLRGYPSMLNCSSVIGMSDFNVRCFRNALPESIPVYKIPYPFRFVDVGDVDVVDIRRRYGMHENDFVVFFNFDFGSSYNRKNPQGVLHAFAEVCRNVPEAKLLFKTKNSKVHPVKLVELNNLAANLGIVDRFICVNDYIPQKDIYGLTSACDVYVSLHRGEGFGLGIAEAMSVGKPVIVTDYSSTTEFCNNSNSIPIPCELVRPPVEMIDHAYYVDVEEWADPDVHAAAEAILRLYRSPELRKALGAQAKASIESQFSIATFRKAMIEFVES